MDSYAQLLLELSKASVEVAYMLYRGRTRVESFADRLDEAGISVKAETAALVKAMKAWNEAVQQGLQEKIGVGKVA